VASVVAVATVVAAAAAVAADDASPAGRPTLNGYTRTPRQR